MVTRVEQNQGTIQLVSGDFTANSDFYVIQMEEGYESHYETVKEQLENYDFKGLINKEPIIVKIKGKDQPSKNIGLSHLNNFMVKLEDQEEEPNDEPNDDPNDEPNDESEEEKPTKKVNQPVVKKTEQTEDINEDKPVKKTTKPMNETVKKNALKKNIIIE